MEEVAAPECLGIRRVDSLQVLRCVAESVSLSAIWEQFRQVSFRIKLKRRWLAIIYGWFSPFTSGKMYFRLGIY